MTWRKVSEAPEYEVSAGGLIRSNYTRRPLKGGLDKDGYRHLVVCTGGRRFTRKIATLVCVAFHGPRPAGAVVRHLDGSRTNNRATNLAWSTQKENIGDKVRHGTHQIGERHPRAKLTEDAVRDIRSSDESAQVMADRYKVKRVTIYAVRSRRLWRHVE